MLFWNHWNHKRSLLAIIAIYGYLSLVGCKPGQDARANAKPNKETRVVTDSIDSNKQASDLISEVSSSSQESHQSTLPLSYSLEGNYECWWIRAKNLSPPILYVDILNGAGEKSHMLFTINMPRSIIPGIHMGKVEVETEEPRDTASMVECMYEIKIIDGKRRIRNLVLFIQIDKLDLYAAQTCGATHEKGIYVARFRTLFSYKDNRSFVVLGDVLRRCLPPFKRNAMVVPHPPRALMPGRMSVT